MAECRRCKKEYKPTSVTHDARTRKFMCWDCLTAEKQSMQQTKVNASIQTEIMSLENRVSKLEDSVGYIDIIVDGAVDAKVNSQVLESILVALVEQRTEKLSTQVATLNSRVLALTKKLQKMEEEK